MILLFGIVPKFLYRGTVATAEYLRRNRVSKITLLADKPKQEH